jgi:hypothetical protein
MHRNDSVTDYDSLNTDMRETMSFQSALDLRVLGACCGSGLNQLNFALVRYRQSSPDATLRLELVQVSAVDTILL